jgi:hypothetical protein
MGKTLLLCLGIAGCVEAKVDHFSFACACHRVRRRHLMAHSLSP